jgi:hypothetical protein
VQVQRTGPMNRYYRTLSLSHQEGPGPVAVRPCALLLCWGRPRLRCGRPPDLGGAATDRSGRSVQDSLHTLSCVQQVQAAQKKEMVGTACNSATNTPRAWAWNRGESIIHPKGKGAGRAIALTGQLDGGWRRRAGGINHMQRVSRVGLISSLLSRFVNPLHHKSVY